MKPDAALLKEILDRVADAGYSHSSVGVDDLQISGVPEDKLQYHVEHLIEEGYLAGQIIRQFGGDDVVLIERMTDKGALLLETTENPEFLEWVKSETGKAFGDLMARGVQSGAAIGWALAKQWLADKGITL